MKKVISMIGLLCVGIAVLSGCSTKQNVFTEKNYTTDSSQIQTINIDAIDRKIDIELSDDNQIYIDYYESEQEFFNIAVSDDHTLTMSYNTEKQWTDYVGFSAPLQNRTIRVRIPQNLLSSLIIKTTNEDITLPSLTVTDSVSMYVNHGNIQFDTLDAGNAISLETKNGNINGTILGSYDDFTIESFAKKGENSLPESKSGGNKILKVFTNNGDIQMDIKNKSFNKGNKKESLSLGKALIFHYLISCSIPKNNGLSKKSVTVISKPSQIF